MGVVHRHRYAVVYAPIGFDALRFKVSIVFKQVFQRSIGVRDMLDADQTTAISLSSLRLQDIQIQESEAMVLPVVGQEGERRILILNLGVKHYLVPAYHLLEATGAVNDVNEFHRTNACHWFPPGKIP